MSSFLASLLAGSNAGAVTPQTDESTGTPSPTPSTPPKKTLSFGAKKAEPARNPQPPSGVPADPVSIAVGLPGDRPLDVRMQPKEKAPVIEAPMTLEDWKAGGSSLTSSIGKFNSLVAGTSGQGPLSYTEATKRYYSSLPDEEKESNPFHRLLGKAQSFDPMDPTHGVVHDAIEHVSRAHGVPDGQALFNSAVHHAIRASALKPKTDPLYWKATGSKLGDYRSELQSLRQAMDPNNPQGESQYEIRKKARETGVKNLTGALAKYIGQSVLADISKQATPERTGITETKNILEHIMGSGDGDNTPMSRVAALTREYVEAYDFDKTELGKDLVAKAANNTLTDEDIAQAAHKWNVKQFIEPRIKPSGIDDPAAFAKTHQEYKANPTGGLQGMARYSSPDFMRIYTGSDDADTLAEQRVTRGHTPFANVSDQETASRLGKSGLDDRTWGQFDSRANMVGALFSGLSLTDDQTRTLAAKMGFNTTAERDQFVMGTGMDGMSGEALMAMEGRVGAVTNANESVEQDNSNNTLAKKVMTGASWVKNSKHFTPDQKAAFNSRLLHISDIATSLTETATGGNVGKGKKQSIAIYHPFALTTKGEGSYEMKDPIGSYKSGHFDMYRPATDISMGPQTVFQTALMFEHAAQNTPYRAQFGYLVKSAQSIAQTKEQLSSLNEQLTKLNELEPKSGFEPKYEARRNEIKAQIAMLDKSLKTVSTASQIQISPIDFEKRIRLAANRVYRDAQADPSFKGKIEGEIGMNIDGNAYEFTTALLKRLQDPAAGPRVMRAIGTALLGADAIVRNDQTKRSGKNTASPTERAALKSIDAKQKAQGEFVTAQLGIPLQELVTKHKPKPVSEVEKARAALGGDLTLTQDEQGLKTRIAELNAKQLTTTGLTEDEDVELSQKQKQLSDSVGARSNAAPQGANRSTIDNDVWTLLNENAKYLIPKSNQAEFIGPDKQLTAEGKRYLQSAHTALSSWVYNASNDNASPESKQRALNAIQFPADAITNIEARKESPRTTSGLDAGYALFPAYDPRNKRNVGSPTEWDRVNETKRDKLLADIGTAHTRLTGLQSEAKSAQQALDTFTALSPEGKEQYVKGFDDGRTVNEHLEKLTDTATKTAQAVESNKDAQQRLALQLHEHHNPDVPFSAGGPMTQKDYEEQKAVKVKETADTNKHIATLNNWKKATPQAKEAAYNWVQKAYQEGTLPPGFDPLPSVKKGAIGAVTRIAYPTFEDSLDFQSGRWTADYDYPHKPRPHLGMDTVQGRIKVPNPHLSILMKVHKDTGVPSFEVVEYKINGTKKTVFARQRIHIAGAASAPHESSFKDGNSYITNSQFFYGVHQKLDPIEAKIEDLAKARKTALQNGQAVDSDAVKSLDTQIAALNQQAQPLRTQLEPERQYKIIEQQYKDRKQAQDDLAAVMKALRNTRSINAQIAEVDKKLTGELTDDERAKLTASKTKLTEALGRTQQSVFSKFGKEFETAASRMTEADLKKFDLNQADFNLLTNIKTLLTDDATAFEANESYDKLIQKMSQSAKGTPLYDLIKRIESLGTGFKRPDKLTFAESGDWTLGETAKRYTKPARDSFKDVGSFVKFNAIMNRQADSAAVVDAKEQAKLLPIKRAAIVRGGFGPNGKLQAANLDAFVKKMWQVAIDESPINLKTTFKKYTDDKPVKYSVARFYNDVWRYLPDHVKANSGVLLQDIPKRQLDAMSARDRTKIESAFKNNSIVLPALPGATTTQPSNWAELTIPNRGQVRFDRPMPAWWEDQVGQLTPKAQRDVRHAVDVMSVINRMAKNQRFPYSVNFDNSNIVDAETSAEARYPNGATVQPKGIPEGPLVNRPPKYKMEEFDQNIQRLMGVHPEYAQMSPAQKNAATQRAYSDILGLSNVYVALNMGWNIRRDAPTAVDAGGNALKIPGRITMTPVPNPPVKFEGSTYVAPSAKQADRYPMFGAGELASFTQAWSRKLYPTQATVSPTKIETNAVAAARNNLDTQLRSHATLEAGLKLAQAKLTTARSEAKSNPTPENIEAAKAAQAAVKQIETQIKVSNGPKLKGDLARINAEYKSAGVYGNRFGGTAQDAHEFLNQLKQQHPDKYRKLAGWSKYHTPTGGLTIDDFMGMDPSKITGPNKAKVGALLDGIFSDHVPQTAKAKVAALVDLESRDSHELERLRRNYNRNKTSKDPSFDKLLKLEGNISDDETEALTKVFDNSSWAKSPVATWFAYKPTRPAVEPEPAGRYTPNLGARVAAQLKRGFTPVNAANLTQAERDFVAAFADFRVPNKYEPVRRQEAHRIVGLVIPEVRKNGQLVTPERTLQIDGPEFRTVLRRMMANPELFKDAQFLQESGIKVFRIGMRKFNTAEGSITTAYDSATRRPGANAQAWLQSEGWRDQQAAELLSGGKAKQASARVEISKAALPVSESTVRIKKVAGKAGMTPLLAITMALMDGVIKGVTDIDPKLVVKGNK